MAIIYRSENRKDYMYLVGEGTEEGLEADKQIHQMILNLYKEHNCHRVLIDDQKVIYTASILSIYRLAEYYANVESPRYIKRAAVVASRAYQETNAFFEDTTRNRGINLRLFYRVEEAEEWLLKELERYRPRITHLEENNMAYNLKLAGRIRAELGDMPIVEKKMFGGIGFLIGGNMACGVYKDDMIVRLDPEKQDKLLKKPGAKVFDITGKPMKGWLMVEPEGCKTKKQLSAWVKEGVAFASTLPAK